MFRLYVYSTRADDDDDVCESNTFFVLLFVFTTAPLDTIIRTYASDTQRNTLDSLFGIFFFRFYVPAHHQLIV